MNKSFKISIFLCLFIVSIQASSSKLSQTPLLNLTNEEHGYVYPLEIFTDKTLIEGTTPCKNYLKEIRQREEDVKKSRLKLIDLFVKSEDKNIKLENENRLLKEQIAALTASGLKVSRFGCNKKRKNASQVESNRFKKIKKESVTIDNYLGFENKKNKKRS